MTKSVLSLLGGPSDFGASWLEIPNCDRTRSNSVQMVNLHLQVYVHTYKYRWDTKEQKCRLVDVDPNEGKGNHSTSVRT